MKRNFFSGISVHFTTLLKLNFTSWGGEKFFRNTFIEIKFLLLLMFFGMTTFFYHLQRRFGGKKS